MASNFVGSNLGRAIAFKLLFFTLLDTTPVTELPFSVVVPNTAMAKFFTNFADVLLRHEILSYCGIVIHTS